MDKNGMFGEILEQGQNSTKNAISDVTKSVKSQVGVPSTNSKPVPSSDGFKGALKSQVGVSDADNKPASSSDGFAGVIKSQVAAADINNQPSGTGDGFTDVIKDQTGIANERGQSKQTQTPSDNSQGQGDVSKQNDSTERTKEVVSEFYAKSDTNNIQSKTQEQMDTQEQLIKTREELRHFQDLHKETYYEPLIAYETKNPQQEESSSERVEKQEMQDLEEKNEKQKNMQPLAVAKAQTAVEANRGVSG